MIAYLDAERTKLLQFPLMVHEITYEQFSDLRAVDQTFLHASKMAKKDKLIQDKGQEFVDKLSEEELEEFLKLTDEDVIESLERSTLCMIDTVNTVCKGAIEEIEMRLPEDDIAKMFKDKFIYTANNIFTEPLSIMRLYIHLTNLIELYEPKEIPVEYEVEWKGEMFYIDPMEAFRTLAGVDYTAGEAISVLDIQKRANERIQELGDLDGNLAFNMGIHELAILLRKKGERLPFNRRKRLRFIDKRAPLFKDLPCNIVFDVRFFFLSTLTRYTKIRFTNSFSRESRMRLNPEKKKRRILNWRPK